MSKEEKRKISYQSFKRSIRVFKYVWPYRLKFGTGLIFLFLSSLTIMIFPGLIGKLIGGSSDNSGPLDKLIDFNDINQLALILLAAFALQAVFSYMRIYLFANVTERAMAALRQDTYAHMIKLPMTFFTAQRVGELNSRITNDISQLQETFMTTLAELIRQIITIVFGVFLLFFFSAELTFVMLVSLPVMMIAAFFFGNFIRKLSKNTQEELARAQVIVDETLQGIQSVKSYAMEFFEIRRYKEATNNARLVAMKGAKWRGAFASFIIFGLFGAIVLVIWYGVTLRNEGKIGLDTLTSFILYSVFVGGSIGGIADIFGRIQKAVGATERLFDLMEEPSEATGNNTVFRSLNGSLQFSDVSFAYASRPDKQVLSQLNFTIEPGQKVAIVGSSGSGKSTIASLVLRFYNPTAGHVLFDEKEASEFGLDEIRSQMALVPQEVLLFGGSIAENIKYGKPDATFEELRQAAGKANALEFIESFPEGFKTIVGERGVQVSGGQRQRIAIARAILKDPKILILDEATSSLDAESERQVQIALDALMEGRTSIIIAHRLSTIRKADKILVLESGAIIESGSHDALMKLDHGLYRRMSELQLFERQ